MYVVSNEVHCIVREDKFLEALRFPTIEGSRSLINRQVQQKFELWRFPLLAGVSNPIVSKSVFASFGEDKTHLGAEVAFGSSLLVLEQQEPGPILKRHTVIWDTKSKSNLQLNFSQAIAFDRTWEHAVIPWQDGVAIVKTTSLTNKNPDVILQTNWIVARQFPKGAYHSHAILSRDGSRLIFLPDGGSRYCCHVLVLGPHDQQQINLPPGLNWNDVIDADFVQGEILFITRNLGSEGDSYQITDKTWKILANLPGEDRWFRPVWDIDGKRLVFRTMSPSVFKVDAPVQFRVWDYQTNTSTNLTVQ